NFGRNATCAADSIFARVGTGATTVASNQNETIMTHNGSRQIQVPIQLPLGDPVPWFGAPTLGDGSFNLQVAAGRWIVLPFLDCADADETGQRTGRTFSQYSFRRGSRHFLRRHQGAAQRSGTVRQANRQSRLLCRGSGWDDQPFVRGRRQSAPVRARSHAARNCEHSLGRFRRTIKTVCELVKGLPDVDNSAGVPLTAPVLTVPRVLDFPLCETLVRVFDEVGGEDSGFLLDIDARTARMIDHRLKRRSDLVVVHPVLREAMRSQVVRRLVPAI